MTTDDLTVATRNELTGLLDLTWVRSQFPSRYRKPSTIILSFFSMALAGRRFPKP